MSDEDSTSDEALDKATLTGSYIYLVVILFGVAIQFAMCMYALWNYQRRPWQRDTKKLRFLIISMMIWVFYSVGASVDTWNIILLFVRPVSAYPMWSLKVSTAMTLIAIFIGDCLMLWRCYVICNRTRYWVIAPTTFFFTATVFGTLSVVHNSNTNFAVLVNILWVFFCVATNVVITSVIIVKLLKARREMVNLNLYNRAPRVYREAIVILVESAAPLALAGLCAVTVTSVRISNLSSFGSMANLYLADLMSHVLFLLFSSLSPQMILFRTLVLAPKGLHEADGSSGHEMSQSAQFSTVQYNY